MRLALFSRADCAKIDSLRSMLTSLGIEVEHNVTDLGGGRFDFAVSLGGDGTFLDAVRQMGASCNSDYLPIIGINSGRLGFLATVNEVDCRFAFESLLRGVYRIENRAMIEVSGIGGAGSTRALNEFSIQKRNVAMIEIQIDIDGSRVAAYWADGVIVSTPTGSTAYSMSVGGSILAPGANCFIVSPIAPHNLSLRPLVIPDRCVIDVSVGTRDGGGSFATIDNSSYQIDDRQLVSLTRSDRTLEVVNIGGNSFYNTLREKLHWGVDIRQQ